MKKIQTIIGRLSKAQKAQLAENMNVSLATLYRRSEDPRTFTVQDLRVIANYFHENGIEFTLDEFHQEVVSRDDFQN